eukprot:gene16359-biopygen4601
MLLRLSLESMSGAASQGLVLQGRITRLEGLVPHHKDKSRDKSQFLAWCTMSCQSSAKSASQLSVSYVGLVVVTLNSMSIYQKNNVYRSRKTRCMIVDGLTQELYE